ncbi:hypothetical protein TURU_164537 [Turdus rufiventris]|nr:hypothetical protein TURU_164537 [Turdus rufiventris]
MPGAGPRAFLLQFSYGPSPSIFIPSFVLISTFDIYGLPLNCWSEASDSGQITNQPVSVLDNKPFSEEFFPNIQTKPAVGQHEVISSGSVIFCLGEETDIRLATSSFQVVVESDEVPPEPPFLQAEHPQTLPQPRCPSLDTFQPLNVFLAVRGPELNTGLEDWPHKYQGHCPDPAGHSTADTNAPVQAMRSQFLQKDTVGEHVKVFTIVKVENINLSTELVTRLVQQNLPFTTPAG